MRNKSIRTNNPFVGVFGTIPRLASFIPGTTDSWNEGKIETDRFKLELIK